MAIVVRNGVFLAAAMPPRVAARRRLGPIRVTLALALLVGGAYAGYQRIGTTANIEFVEYNRNLIGGFLALAMTDRQPGIVVFSALDQKPSKPAPSSGHWPTSTRSEVPPTANKA